MSVAVDFDISDLARAQAAVNKFIGSNVAPLFGDIAVEEIHEHTFQGLDWTGKQFPAYSGWYAGQRRKMGLSSHPVDLSITGGLMGSIGLYGNMTTVSSGYLEVAEKLTAGHSPLQGPRPFLGLDDVGLSKAINKITAEITLLFG